MKKEITDERFKKVKEDPRFKRLKRDSFKAPANPRFQYKEKEEFKDVRGFQKFEEEEYYDELEQNGEEEEFGNEEKEEEDEEEEDEEIEMLELPEQSPKEVIPEGEATSRLAIVNCDWDRIKAVDLLSLLQSFVPTGGAVKSVTVYPSEYGLKKIEEEQKCGPQGIFQELKEENNKEMLDDEVDIYSAFDQERLRQYEKDKMRYYFAVAECDSVQTSIALYNNCDGLEIMKTSNFLDLRYIPDDTSFSQTPKEVAKEIPVNYEPPTSYTKALQQTKFLCSWDLTDERRMELTTKTWTEGDLKEDDWKVYLASDSEDEAEEEELTIEQKREKIREKYKALLEGLDGQSKEAEEMEITFTPGLGESVEKLLEKKKKEEEIEDETVYETSRRLKKERKKERRKQKLQEEQEQGLSKKKKKKKNEVPTEEEEKEKAKLELLTIDEHPNVVEEVSQESKQSKSKKKKFGKKKDIEKQDNFDINELTQDERFSSLYTHPDFAVDRTNPRFKETEGSKIIMKKRVERRVDVIEKEEKEQSKKRPIDSLVESVKKKTKLAFKNE